MPPSQRLAGSFRDPSGFLFRRGAILYRQVNHSYRDQYEFLTHSGLYGKLVEASLLIPHEEVEVEPAEPSSAYRVIRPELVCFISYPYEWSFGQLKDAALLTLEIQKRALDEGMWLKDASAYNIQFRGSQPVHIDTLSFEKYREGEPWVAYRQFCQHFLAPLALMAYADVRLSQLLRLYVDGLPLDLASRLLPWRTRLSFSLLNHIHLHAAMGQRYGDKMVRKSQVKRKMSLTALRGWIDSLESAVHKLCWRPAGTAWADYYQDTNYSDESRAHKEKLIKTFLAQIRPQSVWDLGANTGLYSRLASDQGIPTIAFDVDPGAVERNYQQARQAGDPNLLPLVLDLTNPSPNLGWHNRERDALLKRATPDATLALALIHHLAIANNVPLPYLAQFLSEISPWLIIEFVPKGDSQVERLLATREDVFPDYTQEGFERIFGRRYHIRMCEPLRDCQRILYLMQRKGEM